MATSGTPTNSDRPSWLDLREYPFPAHWFETNVGRLHYVDEGSGRPVVFVHGNPTWSFMFRHQIKALAPTHRCIAPDLLGFGLSDKPHDWSYLPSEQAAKLEELLDSLDLHDMTLVVGDWGGPIGIAYALRHPERIRDLVVSNTWMWSVNHQLKFRLFSGYQGGPMGRYLIKTRNSFAKSGLRGAFGDPERLTPSVHEQYIHPFDQPADRKGSWVLLKQIIGSSGWLQSLWDRREALRGKRFVFIWGMKDPGFGRKELARWSAQYTNSRTLKYPSGGHFLAEELPDEFTTGIRSLEIP